MVPGSSQTIPGGTWQISFRGSDGLATYALTDGNYYFTHGSDGWLFYHGQHPDSGAGAAAASLPPSPPTPFASAPLRQEAGAPEFAPEETDEPVQASPAGNTGRKVPLPAAPRTRLTSGPVPMAGGFEPRLAPTTLAAQ